MMLKKVLIVALIFLLLLAVPACKPADPVKYDAEFIGLFDTLTQIVGYSDNRESFEAEVQRIKDDFEIYHQLYDIYNSYPGIINIKDINDSAGQGPVEVDQKIIDLLLYSIETYELTGGKINIAMGSVLKIWHDHRTAGLADPDSARVPSIEALQTANRHTSLSDLVVDPANRTVEIKDPLMSLDVGAIAKGYATEQIALAAAKRGTRHLLMSVGGNVRAIGYRNEKGEYWRAGIENPTEESDEFLAILNIHDLSVVTSGSYERYYEVDGRRYHHIIDADTLFPEDDFLSVTVVTSDSGLADVLSTALFCMGFDEGLALVERLDQTEALWCFPDGTLIESSGFSALKSTPQS